MQNLPRVDSGMIQVALAIAAAGFLLGDRRTGTAALITSVVYVGSGLAGVILCIVYLSEWATEHLRSRPNHWSRLLALPVAAAYLTLTGLLTMLLVFLGFELLAPRYWLVPIGMLAFGILEVIFFARLGAQAFLVVAVVLLGVVLGAALTWLWFIFSLMPAMGVGG
jgi:hypothetical protein